MVKNRKAMLLYVFIKPLPSQQLAVFYCFNKKIKTILKDQTHSSGFLMIRKKIFKLKTIIIIFVIFIKENVC